MDHGRAGQVRASRQGGKWQCPAHGREGEHSVALAVHETVKTRRAMLHCHAGCEIDDVLRALRITPADLRRTPKTDPRDHLADYTWPKAKNIGTASERGYRFDRHHYYALDIRKERLRHPTTGRSECYWERRNDRGEWVGGLPWGAREADLPLYFGPEGDDLALARGAGEPVVLCESESSVDALRAAGIYATCWPGGAGSVPSDTQRAALDGVRLVTIPDHDEAGRRCLEALRGLGLAEHVLWPDEPGEDARDLLARVGARDLAQRLAAAVEPPTEPVGSDDEPDDQDDDEEDEHLGHAHAVEITDAAGTADRVAVELTPRWLAAPAPPEPALPPVAPTVPHWRRCPGCRAASARHGGDPAQCDACARASVVVFRVTCAVLDEATAALRDPEVTRWCPMRWCDLPSRDQRRGGLCAVCYGAPAGASSSRNRNLTPNAPGGTFR